jgi:hypothetical protein
MADETPTPMPLLVVCRIIITHGNASEAPARALVPMRPRKNPSNVITPANASKVRMFGAARRSNVGRIGPSSSSLVRAAAGEATPLEADDGAEIGALRSHNALLVPNGDQGSAWTKRLLPGPETGRLQGSPTNRRFGAFRRDRKL